MQRCLLTRFKLVFSEQKKSKSGYTIVQDTVRAQLQTENESKAEIKQRKKGTVAVGTNADGIRESMVCTGMGEF